MNADAQLPDKMSDLLELAISDMEKCRARPDEYQLDMTVWHCRDYLKKKCHVCLAGSVLAQTMGAGPGQDGRDAWGDFLEQASDVNTNKLEALNYLRCGLVRCAAMCMGVAPQPWMEMKVVVRQWPHEDMVLDLRGLVTRLREAGL